MTPVWIRFKIMSSHSWYHTVTRIWYQGEAGAARPIQRESLKWKKKKTCKNFTIVLKNHRGFCWSMFSHPDRQINVFWLQHAVVVFAPGSSPWCLKLRKWSFQSGLDIFMLPELNREKLPWWHRDFKWNLHLNQHWFHGNTQTKEAGSLQIISATWGVPPAFYALIRILVNRPGHTRPTYRFPCTP